MGVRVYRSWSVLTLIVAVLLAASIGLGTAVGEDDPSPRRLVATVGTDAVTSEDLVAFWFERERDAWTRSLETLLDERIVEHEVTRLGLTLPGGVLDDAVTEEVAARAALLTEAYGDDVSLADEVLRGYGMDVETWKREVIRPRLRMQHLLVRVVRLDTRRRERVKARVIVLDDEARARSVRGRLDAGADFSLTALKVSVDPTAQAGGDLPSFSRGDLTIPDVETHLFSAPPSALVGPLAVEMGGSTQWHIYKVIEHIPPWTGTRGEMMARLEEDLTTVPMGRAEFERWRARMRRDFRVRVFGPSGQTVVLPAAAR